MRIVDSLSDHNSLLETFDAMHPKIKIAIIIIHFGESETTMHCLNSLFTWASQPYEIYLIDHDPGSGEMLRIELEGSAVRYLRPNQNLGFAGGCNLGAKIALSEGADAVLFLNNDTWVEQDILVDFRKGHTQYQGQCGLTGLIYDANGQVWFSGGDYSLFWMRVEHRRTMRMQESKLKFITGCLMYFPAKIFQELQGFDEQFFLYWEDLDLSLRAKNLSIPLIYLPDIQVFHRVSKSTGRYTQLTRYFQNRNRWLFLKKHGSLKHWIVFVPIFVFGMVKRIIRQPEQLRFEGRIFWDGLCFKTEKGIFQATLQRDLGDSLPVTLEVDATL